MKLAPVITLDSRRPKIVGEVDDRSDRREEGIGATLDNQADSLAVFNEPRHGFAHERRMVHRADQDLAIRLEQAVQFALHERPPDRKIRPLEGQMLDVKN
jgi:hypothetical protein